MGMMKNYFLNLLQQCSEEKFGQDAIDWAIRTGLVPLSYNLSRDVRHCMSRYDEILEAYRHSQRNRPIDEERLKAPAPMKRATPKRRTKAQDLDAPARRRNAA